MTAPIQMRSVHRHVDPDHEGREEEIRPQAANENSRLDRSAQLLRGHLGNADGIGHGEISSRESVGVRVSGGQVAARVTPKLATADDRARRQTSLRLLRLREAAGVTQAEIGKRVGISKRAVGSIERAEVRFVALQAFLLLLDQVIGQKGLDAALTAILTEEQRHAAARGKPRGAEYALSQQINLSDSGAPGGQLCELISVAGGGADSALMPNAHNRAISTFAEGRPSDRCVAEPLILGDTSVLPSARECGARATGFTHFKPARTGGVGCPVVRPTDGLTLVDAQASHPRLDRSSIAAAMEEEAQSGVLSNVATANDRRKDSVAFTGPKGFDTARESETIMPAVSARREQLANPNRKRQRDLRSGCGLIGVGAQGARVAHRRKHTRSAETDCRVPAQIQTVVEAPTPLVPEAVDCLKVDYACERGSESNVVDPSSILGGSTPLKFDSTSAGSNCCGCCVGSAAEAGASSNGQGHRGTLGGTHVVKPVPNPTEGGRPSCSANSTPRRKAA